MVVRGVAVVPRPLQLPRVPCSPEGVGDVGRTAPPRGLISSSVGAFGVSAAWVLVGIVAVVAQLRGSEVSTGVVSEGYSRGSAGGFEGAQLLSLGPRLSPVVCRCESLFVVSGV